MDQKASNTGHSIILIFLKKKLITPVVILHPVFLHVTDDIPKDVISYAFNKNEVSKMCYNNMFNGHHCQPSMTLCHGLYRWLDQVRANTGISPADLWRCADRCGRGTGMKQWALLAI